jgi:hypothetical protein
MPRRGKVRDKPSSAPDKGAGGGAGVSSSASSMQPVKKTGRADAPRDSLASSSTKYADYSADKEVDGSKRRRMDEDNNTPTGACGDVGMDADDDTVAVTDDMDVIDTSTVNNTLTSTAPAPTVRSNDLSSPGSASSRSTGPPVSFKSTAPGAPSASPLRSQQSTALNTDNYVPCFVGHDTLLNRANIDNRRDDALQVMFRVDSRYPACPVVDSLQYKHNATARQQFAATFLGGRNGIHIHAPVIPRFLVEKQSSETLLARDHLNEAQRQWLTELTQQMKQHGERIRTMTGNADENSQFCDDLFQHLDLLVDNDGDDGKHAGLWSGTLLASHWSDLLTPPTDMKAYKDSRSQSQSHSRSGVAASPSHISYQLTLHTATPEAAYVIACTIYAYSRMRAAAPAVTESLTKLLDKRSGSSGQPADSTDSDEDDGWQRQRSDKSRAKRTDRSREYSLKQGLEKLAACPDMKSATEEFCFLQNTHLPLLALATEVSMRPVLSQYVSFLVDNFQTAGCNIYDLANDATYIKITQSRPEFCHPIGHWSVDQRIGNGTASLLVREDYKDTMAVLNEHVRALLQQPATALRVACTVLKKNRYGRLDYNTYTKVFLTPDTKVSAPPRWARPPLSGPSSSSPSTPAVALGPYAARLADGLKRAAEQAALNHRPRKEQKQTSQPPASSAVSKQHTQLLQLPQQQQQQQNNMQHPAVSNTNNTIGTAHHVTTATLDSRLAVFQQSLTKIMDDHVTKLIDTQMGSLLDRLAQMMPVILAPTLEKMAQSIMTSVISTLSSHLVLSPSVTTELTAAAQTRPQPQHTDMTPSATSTPATARSGPQSPSLSSPHHNTTVTVNPPQVHYGSNITLHPFSAFASPALNGQSTIHG